MKFSATLRGLVPVLLLVLTIGAENAAADISGSVSSLTTYTPYDLSDGTDDWVAYGGLGTTGSGTDMTTGLSSSSFSSLSVTGTGPYTQSLNGVIKFAHDAGYGSYPSATSSIDSYPTVANSASQAELSFTHTMLSDNETVTVFVMTKSTVLQWVDIEASINTGGSWSVTNYQLPTQVSYKGCFGVVTIDITNKTAGDVLTFTLKSNYTNNSNPQSWWGVGISGAYVEYVAPTNTPPSVNAGSDDSITLPNDEVSLDGTVNDDGLPDPPASCTVLWTKESGPGTVTFDDDEAVDTDATFSAAGTYVLRLTADDGDLDAYDEVTITVNAAPTIDGSVGTLSAYNVYGLTDGISTDWVAYGGLGTAGSGTDKTTATSPSSFSNLSITGTGPYTQNLGGVMKFAHAAGYGSYPSATASIDSYPVVANSASQAQMSFTHTMLDGNETLTVYILTKADVLQWVDIEASVNTGGSWSVTNYQLPTQVAYRGCFGVVTIDIFGKSPGDVVTFTLKSNYTNNSNPQSWWGIGIAAATCGPVMVEPDAPTLVLDRPQVFNYGSLELVDEIDCGDPYDSHTLYESSAGVSEIQTILGDQCRVIPNDNSEPSYFAYRIGEDCDLEAGKGYILVVEYPEDVSRSTIVCNYGCETNSGFHTGVTVGDALVPPCVASNPESICYGFSGQYEQWQQLFHLHDRTPEVIAKDGTRDFGPEDGFYVVIAQFMEDHDPLSNGAAVRRIALYEAPTEANFTQQLATLPAGLPKRHIFWREEMGDGAIQGTESEWATIDPIDWYRFKAKLARFLGVNTYTKDLLEFGHCQDWDVAKYANWYTYSSNPYRWQDVLVMLANEGYDDLDVLPYYEYSGSTATSGGLGRLKRAEPLSGLTYYTHVSWCEDMNVDVSDPDVLTDSVKLLDATITDLYAGGRPISKPATGDRIGGGSSGYWGYVDFGPDYDDLRIIEGWTRSRDMHGGPASPFQAVYWHSNYSDFSGGVPPAAIQENTINFITQAQSGGGNYWTKDFGLSQGNAITPQARYLLLQQPTTITMTDAMELAFIGWVEDGGDPDIETLTPVGAGWVTSWFPLNRAFDNQPEYNTEGMNFLGAWWRMRPSAIPNGFSDTTLERFRQDISYGTAVTRSTIVGQGLMDDYYEWWNLERKAYCEYLRDYLQTNVSSDAVFLYTCDHTESGATHPTAAPDIVTDWVPRWETLVDEPLHVDAAVALGLQLEALELPLATWGSYEWNHSAPMNDPWNYEGEEDLMLTYSFNRLYTVGNADALADYQNDSDQMAMMRHYCLNEYCMKTSADVELLGYFACDMEVAGPYCTLPEARAIAYGDPTYLGYLAGNNFNRGFPGYVREFNANFLALPALPMATETSATTEENVVVRSISTANDGTWLAIINVGLEDLEDVEITLPVSGTTTDAVTGSAVTVSNGKITLDLWPGRVKSIHIDD